MEPTITVYTSRTCPVCRMLKDFLNSSEIPYSEVSIDLNPVALVKLMGKSGRFTVPQTEVNGTWISGFDPVRLLDAMNQQPVE